MPQTTNASPNSAGRESHRWLAQFRELFAARYELAELEVRSDIDASRRLGIVGGIGLVLALTGLPVLVIVLGGWLGEATVVDAVWWQLSFGLISLLVGLAILWLSLRTFRREFAGLRETLAELREDAAWVKEMAAEYTPAFPSRPANSTQPDAE